MNFLILATNHLSTPLVKDVPLYLDPGSGSILIQLLIASVLGAVLVLKTSWGRIKQFFRKNTTDSPDDEFGDRKDE